MVHFFRFKICPVIVGLTLVAVSCAGPSGPAGTLADPLVDEAWDCSQWISAADAPIVTGAVHSATNCRAADGSSWFVSTVANSGKVVSARWMTTGLGVYDIYVNGKLIGTEVLKPGFTHYAKTKISYTYDITDAVLKGAGKENQLAPSAPCWNSLTPMALRSSLEPIPSIGRLESPAR